MSRAKGGRFDHLGKSLLMLRVMQGLSQAEVAARAGIRPNQVSHFETGQVLPQLDQRRPVRRPGPTSCSSMAECGT